MKTNKYEVTGFGHHGFYTEIVEAESLNDALLKATPLLKRIAFGPIIAYRVREYR